MRRDGPVFSLVHSGSVITKRDEDEQIDAAADVPVTVNVNIGDNGGGIDIAGVIIIVNVLVMIIIVVISGPAQILENGDTAACPATRPGFQLGGDAPLGN